MNALLVGDLHTDNEKSSIANSNSFYEVFKTLTLIKETIIKYKPDYTIFFGDIFNSPRGISTTVITIMSKLFSEMSEETSLIFIVGNHDDVDEKISRVKVGDRFLNLRSSLLSPFSYFPNVAVFDSPQVIKIDEGVEIGFIPFSNRIREDVDSIQSKFSRGVKKLLFGHFELKDSTYMIVKDGAETVSNPSANDLIKKYKYDMVLLGHIHDISDYNIDEKVVKYIGSCRNVDFRNLGENKGIYLLDFKTLDMEFIENEHTCIYKIFKNLEDFKEYCTNSSPEKLSRTKIRYIYTNSNEVKEISKIKDSFKSLQFQKNLIGIDSTSDNASTAKAIEEFENLVHGDLVTKENLIDYAISFKEPINKDHSLNTLDLILKSNSK